MNNKLNFNNLNAKPTDVYNLSGFTPNIVDKEYLTELGVKVEPSQETLAGLIRGSELFKQRISTQTLIPIPKLEFQEIDINSELEIHNYTNRCPALTYEVNPVKGCNVGCLYCLVTDGVHEQQLITYTNYHLLIRRHLEEKHNEEHYYYFSPKTEAFQEPSLETGVAHKILKEFVYHFKKHPDSKIRLFIASKAGIKQLNYAYEGETILDLFIELKDKMQFNTSVSIMPTDFRAILEPYAASLDERLAAVKLCQENGILSDSALIQPIVAPYLTDEHIKEFFDLLHANGIINYKPEFLTACMENLSMIGQLLGYYDKSLEKELYEYYISPSNADHKKQRGRTAPNRDLSIHYIKKMMDYTNTLDMSVSICYWVRHQLNIAEEFIPIINRNGYQCLGYQSRLFE